MGFERNYQTKIPSKQLNGLGYGVPLPYGTLKIFLPLTLPAWMVPMLILYFELALYML